MTFCHRNCYAIYCRMRKPMIYCLLGLQLTSCGYLKQWGKAIAGYFKEDNNNSYNPGNNNNLNPENGVNPEDEKEEANIKEGSEDQIKTFQDLIQRFKKLSKSIDEFNNAKSEEEQFLHCITLKKEWYAITNEGNKQIKMNSHEINTYNETYNGVEEKMTSLWKRKVKPLLRGLYKKYDLEIMTYDKIHNKIQQLGSPDETVKLYPLFPKTNPFSTKKIGWRDNSLSLTDRYRFNMDMEQWTNLDKKWKQYEKIYKSDKINLDKMFEAHSK